MGILDFDTGLLGHMAFLPIPSALPLHYKPKPQIPNIEARKLKSFMLLLIMIAEYAQTTRLSLFRGRGVEESPEEKCEVQGERTHGGPGDLVM